ncbi:MAG: hypothetical protein JXA18_06365 [Chitinispirillaceae bacterium]|nr:hypothetical protein [Chitinispirillaceae bacterium]
MRKSTDNVSSLPAGVKSHAEKVGRYGIPAVLFVFYFIYVLAYIDPAMIYSSNGFNLPSFIRYLHEKERNATVVHEPSRYSGDGYILECSPRYFRDLFSAPGGLTKLIVTLVIYSCNYSVIGAFVITGLAGLLFYLFLLVVRRDGGDMPSIVPAVPALVVLYIAHLYELDALAYVVPITGALAFIILFRRLSGSGNLRQAATLIVISWTSWYLLQWASLLLLAIVLLDALFIRRHRLPLLIAAGCNAGLFFLIEGRFLVLGDAVRAETFFARPWPPVILIAWFPLIILLGHLRPGSIFGALRARRNAPLTRLTTEFFLVTLLTAIVVTSARLNPVLRDVRAMARTVHHLQNKQWDEVLDDDFSTQFRNFPEKSGPLQRYLIHARDRCLAETGLLGEKMFSFPQATFSPEPLLLRQSLLDHGFPLWAAAAKLFMELGLVNYAEKTIGELMECMGPYPFLMWERSLLHLAKNNQQAASVYLKKLSAMPFYRKEARQLLAILGDSSAIAAHPRIEHLRSCMDTTDYYFLSCNEEGLLRHLLGANPKNRLAFDYLQAYYLMTGKAGKLIDEIRNAPSLGYTTLPRHWEEGICVYLTREDGNPADAAEHIARISPATFRRFDRFMQMYFSLEGDPSAAKKLGPLFGSTYYYFYSFESTYGEKR